MMNFILCGLPTSGKTTVGKMLAEKLNGSFIDTDQLIEETYAAKTGKALSCRQIFLQEGEGFFRHFEREQILSLSSALHRVIAVGGGSLQNPENKKMLQMIGCLIYLKVPVDVLWKRIQKHGIPAYLDGNDPQQAFYALADMRIPVYEQAAHIVIETANLSEQQVVEAIVLETFSKFLYQI